MAQVDPKQLLQALERGELPSSVSPEDAERSQALLRGLSTAAPDQVAALPGPLALALLEAAAQGRHVALVDALTRAGDKALEKAARKALYKLRSAGLEIPEHRPPVAKAGPTPASTPEELPAFLSSLTGTGERALLVTKPARGGGLELAQIVFSDEHGLVQVGLTQLGRSAFRKQVAQLRRSVPPSAIEVSLDEARQTLAEAAGLNLESRTPYPPNAEEVLRVFGARPLGEALTLPPPEPEDAGLSQQGHELHNERELQPWLPPESELRLVAQKAQEVVHSPIQLSDTQRSEQVLNAFRSSARAFFDERMRKLYARRLWRMGEYFERTGRERPARLARAEARRLFHGELSPFSRFAEFLFEKVLMLSELAAAEGGLPAPGEATPLASAEPGAPPAPEERRSPGGLILP